MVCLQAKAMGIMECLKRCSTPRRGRILHRCRGSRRMNSRRGDVVWWEVETSCPEVFQRFHGELWGWSFRPSFEGTELNADYWIIQRDGDDVGGLQRGASDAPSSGSRVYLRVDDLESTLARVVQLGGTVQRPRVALDGTQWFALFRDPTGVEFGLWTVQSPQA